MQKASHFGVGVGVVVALLLIFVGIYLALPFALKNYAEKKLNESENLVWSIESADLSVIPLALRFGDMSANLKNADESLNSQVVHLENIYVGLSFKALLQGKFELNMRFIKPKIYLRQELFEKVDEAQEEEKKEDLEKKILNWREELVEFIPFKISNLDVHHASVEIMLDMDENWFAYSISNLEISAKNLTNRQSLTDELFASCEVRANLEGGGDFQVSMKLDPIRRPPAIDMNMRVEKLKLEHFNPILERFGSLDLEKGELSVYSEVKLENFRYDGYVKTLAKEIDILGESDKNNGPLQILWEALVAGGAEILENQREDQVALRANFEGRIKNPDVNTWDAVGSLLQNAFIRALLPGLENEIEFGYSRL